jgi:uncharacterized membrane protein HdeD (DUF308 family)
MSSYDQSPFASTVRQGRNRIIAVGIVMILAGVAAIAFPLISSLSVVWIVGVMLIVASIAQSVSAFSYPKWGGIILGLLIAALWLAGGLYLLMRPLEGIFALTVIVAVAFLAEGTIKTLFSLQMRPHAGWGWVLFDGVVSVALGLMLWWQLPSAALWSLGTLAGISIIISGWTLVIVPIAVSKVFGTSAFKELAA